MRREQQEALVGILTQAFADDEIFNFVLPDSHRRARAKALLYRASLRYTLRYGRVEVAPENQGVALWLPPGAEHLSLLRMVQTGFLPFAGALGAGLGRMLQVDHVLNRMHRVHVPERHYYLFFLATVPEAQGKGVGSTLLAKGLAQAGEERVPVYLETQRAINVAFYQSRGFVVREERNLAPGLCNWALRAEPRGR